MNRRIFLVAAGILAASSASCVVPQPPVAGPGISSRALPPTPLTRTACQFAALAPKLWQITDSSYDPSVSLTAPSNTQVSQLSTTTQEYKDLQNAFLFFPDFFKNQLCALSGLYIIPSGSSRSWGFRDSSLNGYVGVSDDLWSVNAGGDVKTPLSLSAYENSMILPTLVAGIDMPPKYSGVKPDTGTLMLAAALAHELGHVLWNSFISPRTFNSSTLIFGNFCPNGVFPNASWSTSAIINQVQWRSFGIPDNAPNVIYDQDDPNPTASNNNPTPQELNVTILKSYITAGKFKRARNVIARMLSPRRAWPSLFGAFSANEDFVETYVLYVLMQPILGLTAMPLQVVLGNGNTATIDIPGDLLSGNRSILAAKLLCFDDYLLRNPP
jgi:hypothetical protein